MKKSILDKSVARLRRQWLSRASEVNSNNHAELTAVVRTLKSASTHTECAKILLELLDEIATTIGDLSPRNYMLEHFRYQCNEVYAGVSDSLYGTRKMFLSPITWAKDTVNSTIEICTTRPDITLGKFAAQCYNRPARTIANFATGRVTSMGLGIGSRMAFNKLSGANDLWTDLTAKYQTGQYEAGDVLQGQVHELHSRARATQQAVQTTARVKSTLLDLSEEHILLRIFDDAYDKVLLNNPDEFEDDSVLGNPTPRFIIRLFSDNNTVTVSGDNVQASSGSDKNCYIQ